MVAAHVGLSVTIYFLDVAEANPEEQVLLPNDMVNPTGVVLGRGTCAEVLEVTYRGRLYAAKRLMGADATVTNLFSREHEILARIRHHNIVPFCGVCRIPTDNIAVLVMPKMKVDLHNFLHDQECISIDYKYSLLLDILNGLNYLHQQIPPIVHRDLTASNVLIHESGVAKIGDFGNSQVLDQTATVMCFSTDHHGTIDHMPPERVEGDEYSEKLDIFSFGHLAIHVIIQDRPYPLLSPTYRKDGKLFARSEAERRQPYLERMQSVLVDCEKPLYSLILQCLNDAPTFRPSCADIKVSVFIDIKDSLPSQSHEVNESSYAIFPSLVVNPTGLILGSGTYGDVLEVEYKGILYAAKKYRISHFNDIAREHEILTRIRHVNIVSYCGICKLSTDKSTVIIMERMKFNLSCFLHEHELYPLHKKVRLLFDTAAGLNHLHSRRPAIIHRDLSANNVLLDSNGVAKISDFGNSRIVDFSQTPEIFTSNPGTLDYMPPEALEGGSYTDKLDTFSYGHLAIHIILQRRPHPILRPTYRANGRLFPRTEVERRSIYIDAVKKLLPEANKLPLLDNILKCLKDDPEERPSSCDILRWDIFK